MTMIATTRTRPEKTAARLRRALWRTVFTLSGGFRSTGHLPDGGCVVVVNHSSHADTAAVLAALDAHHAPRVAAAADYWFAKGWRRGICKTLAAGFPVRRSGGGMADLEEVLPLLRAGHAVVVYPEGTRGDGEGVAEFRSGALRLAQEAGVPVVPVGITGTAQLLPKHGKISPTPVTVRIGQPLHGPTAEHARDAVQALVGPAPEPVRDSWLRQRTAAFFTSWRGPALAAVWAFGEALSWPLLPELLLAAVCAAAPKAGLRLVPFITAGTIAGGVLMTQLSTPPPAPWTTVRMHQTAQEQIQKEGPSAVARQPWNGVPYKVYAAAAGRTEVKPTAWAWETFKARSVRNLSVGLAFSALGVLALRWRRHYPDYLVLLSGCFVVGLSLIVWSWA